MSEENLVHPYRQNQGPEIFDPLAFLAPYPVVQESVSLDVEARTVVFVQRSIRGFLDEASYSSATFNSNRMDIGANYTRDTRERDSGSSTPVLYDPFDLPDDLSQQLDNAFSASLTRSVRYVNTTTGETSFDTETFEHNSFLSSSLDSSADIDSDSSGSYEQIFSGGSGQYNESMSLDGEIRDESVHSQMSSALSSSDWRKSFSGSSEITDSSYSKSGSLSQIRFRIKFRPGSHNTYMAAILNVITILDTGESTSYQVSIEHLRSSGESSPWIEVEPLTVEEVKKGGYVFVSIDRYRSYPGAPWRNG